MDFHTYMRFTVRKARPKTPRFSDTNRAEHVFMFDTHYALAASHWQELKTDGRKTLVMMEALRCPPASLNNGEDNAMYTSYDHFLVQCPGAGGCANPLIYQYFLFPLIPDLDEYLRLLQGNPHTKRVALRFLPAWRARRSEIEVLADRAAKKHTAAMRIGVIHDTTTFNGVRIPRSRLSAAAEHGFDARLRQVLLLQIERRNDSHPSTCPERIAALLMEYLDVPPS